MVKKNNTTPRTCSGSSLEYQRMEDMAVSQIPFISPHLTALLSSLDALLQGLHIKI